jgi:hypothetical protein
VPQLQRFEGATPEEARTKARRALGDDVVIVRAGRERSGGVLGFFEHEVFVLEVDAASVPPATHRGSSKPAPRSARAGAPAGADALERLIEDIEDHVGLGELTRQARGEHAVPADAFSDLLDEAEATVAAARPQAQTARFDATPPRPKRPPASSAHPSDPRRSPSQWERSAGGPDEGTTAMHAAATGARAGADGSDREMAPAEKVTRDLARGEDTRPIDAPCSRSGALPHHSGGEVLQSTLERPGEVAHDDAEYFDGADNGGADNGGADNGGAQLEGAQVGTAQVGTRQVDGAQVDAAQVDAAQVDGAQVDGAQFAVAGGRVAASDVPGMAIAEAADVHVAHVTAGVGATAEVVAVNGAGADTATAGTGDLDTAGTGDLDPVGTGDLDPVDSAAVDTAHDLATPGDRPAAPEREVLRPHDEVGRRMLAGLGLPVDLMPATGMPIDTGLVERLRALPAPPPLPAEPDCVVLVTGPSQHLGALALHLARRLGIGTEGVITVLSRPRGLPDCSLSASSAREAAALVADRRIAGQPTLVAVECRPDGRLSRLLPQVAAAVRADATWAVVPACCEPEQLQALAEAVRGLDACCLVELDRAEQPAALLAVQCPIAAVDWRAATPILWAARLLDRCTAEEQVA